MIPDLDEHEVKEILHEVEQTNLQVLLKMKDDIFDDAAHNIKKAQKKPKEKIMTLGIQATKLNWK